TTALRELLIGSGGALPDGAPIDAAALSTLLPELGASGAMPDDPLAARFRMFEATAQLLRASGARLPVLLVLDDLHGADPSSLVLLRFLARAIRSARVLLVGALRPRDLRSPVVTEELARIGQETTTLTLA